MHEQVAVVGGHFSCIKLLVASKAKIHMKNEFDETPSEGIPFSTGSPEYGACMRALGQDYKSSAVKKRPIRSSGYGSNRK